MSERPTAQYAFPAMSSTVELLLVGGRPGQAERSFRHAERRAVEWERTFSRFRPDSELSRLNGRAGARVVVSTRLFDAVARAVAAARATEGLFDPTVLPSLAALGYDRTFAQIGHGERLGAMPVSPPAPGVAGIELEPDRQAVTLPPDVALDLGGIAKGLYADLLASELADWPGGMVSAGGDLRLWGQPPDGDRWQVGVEDPDRVEQDLATLVLGSDTAGVATSGTNRRHWRRGDMTVHHLVDPRTGVSADTGLRSVTAVAATAAQAEVAATALFVAGSDRVLVERLRLLFQLAIVVTTDRRIKEIHGATSETPLHEPVTAGSPG